MARPTQDFPTRVLAIAVVIAVLLAILVWLLSGLGSPPVDGNAAPPDEETAPLLDPEVSGDPGDAAAPEGADGGDETAPTAPTGEAAGEQVTLQLYLAQAGSRELVPRVRRIRAPAHPAARAQMALQALINAGEPGYASPLPATTMIREVWVDAEHGIAYVDFARGFPQSLGGGSLSEIHAVYGVVGTLAGSFPEIAAVQFLVEGQPVESFTGHLDLTLPIARSSDWLY